jgi:hypothetical protein
LPRHKVRPLVIPHVFGIEAVGPDENGGLTHAMVVVNDHGSPAPDEVSFYFIGKLSQVDPIFKPLRLYLDELIVSVMTDYKLATLNELGVDRDMAELGVVHVRGDIARFAAVDPAWDAVPLVVSGSEFTLFAGHDSPSISQRMAQ